MFVDISGQEAQLSDRSCFKIAEFPATKEQLIALMQIISECFYHEEIEADCGYDYELAEEIFGPQARVSPEESTDFVADFYFDLENGKCCIHSEPEAPGLSCNEEAVARAIQKAGIFGVGFAWHYSDPGCPADWGAGWCAIFEDRIEIRDVKTTLEQALGRA